MTAINSVGAGNSQLNSYVVNSTSSVDADTASQSSTDPLVAEAASSASGTSTQALGDLRSQIETAVTTAVNGLDPSSSPADIAAAVKGAVSQTLQQNGIDPQQLGGAHGHRHHHHRQAQLTSSDPPPASVDGSDPDGDGTDSSSDSTSGLLSLIENLQAGQSAAPPNASGANPPGGSLGTSNNASNQNALLLAALQNSNSGASLAQLLSDPTSQAGLGGNSPLSGGNNLNSLFAQLFAAFPNGTGVDVQA